MTRALDKKKDRICVLGEYLNRYKMFHRRHRFDKKRVHACSFFCVTFDLVVNRKKSDFLCDLCAHVRFSDGRGGLDECNDFAHQTPTAWGVRDLCSVNCKKEQKKKEEIYRKHNRITLVEFNEPDAEVSVILTSWLHRFLSTAKLNGHIRECNNKKIKQKKVLK